MRFVWGTEIARRTDGIPFLMYAPRRRQVCELLDDAARWVGRTHLVQGRRRLSFADLFDHVERLAAVFGEQGLGPGDRLLLVAPNSPEWVVAFWAGLRVGAIVAVGNGWWSEPEFRHAVELVTPALVIIDADRSVAPGLGVRVLPVVGLLERTTESPAPPPHVPDEDDPALIVFTAGTTGTPKGVVLAHRSVIANLHNLLAVSGRLPQQLDPDRSAAVILQSGPLFHMGGVQTLLLALIGGSTIVFLSGRFDPAEVLDLIEGERITVWGAIPTMATRVLAHPTIAGRDLSSVRSVSMGGAPVQPEVLDHMREYFPGARRGLSTIYGMTETGGTVASASGALMAEHPDTAGRALPAVELRIDRPDGEGNGEIVVRTPGQLLGYWGEAKADLLDDDGFVHTGDQGRLVDGLLFVTGRLKDLIIRGGENIAPAQVEAALLKHPAVRNAVVIGRPDGDLGEIVAAAVQVASVGSVDVAALVAHMTPLLPRFAVPAQWWITTDPLPMTDAGKPDKRALAALWPS